MFVNFREVWREIQGKDCPWLRDILRLEERVEYGRQTKPVFQQQNLVKKSVEMEHRGSANVTRILTHQDRGSFVAEVRKLNQRSVSEKSAVRLNRRKHPSCTLKERRSGEVAFPVMEATVIPKLQLRLEEKAVMVRWNSGRQFSRGSSSPSYGGNGHTKFGVPARRLEKVWLNRRKRCSGFKPRGKRCRKDVGEENLKALR
ncbi:hypothetical protein C8R47DRAFT_1074151 [Mycena vitilis]|nr:hypothetical protein C8R47DRAFT_1074151 [Mycena vitilis]